ncbi:N-acetylmuramoyl-L-alanine amidase, partial [Endozoicomonas sp. SM1973]
NGRPDYWPGAHVKNYNQYSLGVCLIARNTVTSAQLVSLHNVINDWLLKYPKAEVLGHCDLDPGKTCPNFDVISWWSVVKDIRRYSQGGNDN